MEGLIFRGNHLPNTNNPGDALMKKKVTMTIMFFLFSISIYADNEFLIKERNLLERGYTKTNPNDYFYTWILKDCYEKIFNKNWIIDQPSIRHFFKIEFEDDFFYDLFYLLDDELPNILTIVYLKNDGKIYSYYKMNLALDGVKITTIYGELLVFY
jgi:hypothetical protein